MQYRVAVMSANLQPAMRAKLSLRGQVWVLTPDRKQSFDTGCGVCV